MDNFKETLEKFITYLKPQNVYKDIRYNSFEDIKEQDNDDSLHEQGKKSTLKVGSDIVLS